VLKRRAHRLRRTCSIGEADLLTLYTGGVTGERLGRGSAEGQLLARLPLIDRIFPGTADAYLRGSAVRMYGRSPAARR
jgi:hypothetical protein